MHYEINYNSLDGQVKRDKAIEDIKSYITPKQFGIIGDVAMRAEVYYQLSFVASFAGVQGYPVAALWDETRQEMRDMTS